MGIYNLWEILLFQRPLADPCYWCMVDRADSKLAPSQWEMALQSNAISHWLGPNLESALVDNELLALMLHKENVKESIETLCTWDLLCHLFTNVTILQMIAPNQTDIETIIICMFTGEALLPILLLVWFFSFYHEVSFQTLISQTQFSHVVSHSVSEGFAWFHPWYLICA